jgi:hypothetical protein
MIFALTFSNLINAASQTQLTGSCGLLINQNNNGWEGVLNNFGAQATNTTIGTINFDKGTFKFLAFQVYPYGNKNHVDEILINNYGTLSFISFDSESGIYTYTGNTSIDANAVLHFYVLPVNSGNTFFVTGYMSIPNSATTPIAAGICQKI